MSEDQNNETIKLSLEKAAPPESDCLACDALDYFCTTIDDEDAKSKCAASVKAVQEGLLDAGKAREEILAEIGEEAYEQSVEKTNDWISDRFERTRSMLAEAARSASELEGSPIDISDKMLPEESDVPDVPIDESDKFLPEE